MSSISDVDHAAFFPIKIDQNTAPDNRDSSVQPANASAAERLNFERVLQAFLMDQATAGDAQSNSGDPLLSLLMLNQNGGNGPQGAASTLQASLLAQYLGQGDAALAKYGLTVNNLRQLSGVGAVGEGAAQSAGGIFDGTSLGVNPTKREVMDYIAAQCRMIGIPPQLGLATAATESSMTQFAKDGSAYRGVNSDSADWGIMQINDKAWGDAFDLDRLKSDWQYNVRAGLQILKNEYELALKNNEANKGGNSAVQNLSRAAYSGYNAGGKTQWRYRTPIASAPRTEPYGPLSNDGYDLRDLRFWHFYQQF